MIYEGKGVTQSCSKAEYWYAQAANQGRMRGYKIIDRLNIQKDLCPFTFHVFKGLRYHK